MCIRDRNYCIVDGGLNHLNYYGQAMAMKMPHHKHIPDAPSEASDEQSEEQSEVLWNICGSLCTVNDVLVKQMPLKHAKIGDALVSVSYTHLALIFLIMYIFYLRFTPKMAIVVLLTPLAFALKIPVVVPISCAL